MKEEAVPPTPSAPVEEVTPEAPLPSTHVPLPAPVVSYAPPPVADAIKDAPHVEPHPVSNEKDISASEKGISAQDAEKSKKRQSFLVRTLWTFIMIGGFIGLLLMGHVYMICLVMICQTAVYREVTALFSLRNPRHEEEHGKDPWRKTLNWYFFVVTNYFLYGESIIYYFKHVVFADAQLLPFATNHRIISFTLYTIGFVGFVASLKRGYLKQQFGLFCWVHMSLLIIVVSSHFIVNNILEGLIWFWVPASLVICNDVFAYVWGITFGRTPLIKLSPKKTVEGFVGAFFSTIIFGVLWGTYFMRFNYMICPVRELGVSAWSQMQCEPNPAFVWRDWEIWAPLRVVLSTLLGRAVTTIPYAPYQFHLLFMSCFASLVAPFGGFFASGFKRAFNIKDFGHSIPGHGGMTDRMDCQFLMGIFTYVYYTSLVRQHSLSVGSVLQMIVSGLSRDEQLELLADFRRYLEGQGVELSKLRQVAGCT
ncbi:hypothetical protein JAAARDRAFT_130741 [Jaapia argillacea MUCL 33604]|uniref:Phosphatidate cytidylyltransferase n=1 Tax=Jaapia argillacea MUCL 33604 TaxID=933084 RepID=A0A067PUD8_9AGAM|nr:hypothetical protein JAAARDRAFT_130741 [Jaapia argillacea MUCL 33604]